jgi:dephospho-CoA kinase
MGAVVVDFDQIAKDVLQPGKPAWSRVMKEFAGQDILTPQNTIDRAKLSHLCFSDPTKTHLRKLNAIMKWPMFKLFVVRLFELFLQKQRKMVVVDAPLLFESGLYRLCDYNLLICVEKEAQIARLVARDGLTKVQAEQKIAAQMPQTAKVKLASEIIENNRDLLYLEAEGEAWYLATLLKQPSLPTRLGFILGLTGMILLRSLQTLFG